MAIQTFVADTILTAAQMNALQGNDYNQTVNTSTASYVLIASDKGTKRVMNSASATTITVNTSLFSAGDTLTILNIGAGVCTVTAGTATVSTTGSLALAQNGGGTLYFTSAGVSVFEANGVVSKIAQVVFGSTTTALTSSVTTYATTGLTATITPTLATSSVLVLVSQNGLEKTVGNSLNSVSLRLLRGATNISQFAVIVGFTNSALVNIGAASVCYLDSPNTTSATTYVTHFANINAAAASAGVQANSAMSTIILMEVLA